MATASKRFSRKDLKRPDWFQVNSELAFEFFAGHKPLMAGAAVALVLIVAAIWGWQQFKARQNVAAAQEYLTALNFYHTEKYREAIGAFEKVQTYRWSHYAPLAHIYLANSYLASNDADKALSAAQRSVTATKPNTLYRQIALIALATAEERKNRCKEAIEHYREAEGIAAALQSRAILGKAQCAEQVGDTATAIAALKEYLKENPGSPYAIKLAELEAKVPPAPKAAK
jgi:hypothetical protein